MTLHMMMARLPLFSFDLLGISVAPTTKHPKLAAAMELRCDSRPKQMIQRMQALKRPRRFWRPSTSDILGCHWQISGSLLVTLPLKPLVGLECALNMAGVT